MSAGPIWFGVTKWRDEPEERQFDRATESRLYYKDRGRSRFENKWSQYKQWYPNREEAQAAIDRRKANNAERERTNRIRDAAPDLLAACEFQEHIQSAAFKGDPAEAIAKVREMRRAAIAKARGEVA